MNRLKKLKKQRKGKLRRKRRKWKNRGKLSWRENLMLNWLPRKLLQVKWALVNMWYVAPGNICTPHGDFVLNFPLPLPFCPSRNFSSGSYFSFKRFWVLRSLPLCNYQRSPMRGWGGRGYGYFSGFAQVDRVEYNWGSI